MGRLVSRGVHWPKIQIRQPITHGLFFDVGSQAIRSATPNKQFLLLEAVRSYRATYDMYMAFEGELRANQM